MNIQTKIKKFGIIILTSACMSTISMGTEQQDMINSHNKWRSTVKTVPVT